MSNIPNLNMYFLNNKDKFSSNNTSNEEIPISKAFAKIFYSIFDMGNILDVNNLNLDALKIIIGNEENKYKANNLIYFLYNKMHEELNSKKNNNIVINDNSDKTNMAKQIDISKNQFDDGNKSIISDNFYFRIVNENKCLFCNNCLYECEMLNNIVFSLSNVIQYKQNECINGFQSVNIYDCFNYYFQSVSSESCENCGSQPTTKKLLNSLPNIINLFQLFIYYMINIYSR
jgi:ubiquitin C-terminal hydrolase